MVELGSVEDVTAGVELVGLIVVVLSEGFEVEVDIGDVVVADVVVSFGCAVVDDGAIVDV